MGNLNYDSSIFLVTLDEAKRFLKQDAAIVASDDVIGFLMSMVSSLFDDETNRSLAVGQRTEYYDGRGTDVIYLKNYPIAASPAPQIWDDPDQDWDADDMWDTDDYRLDRVNGLLRSYVGWFAQGAQNVKVIYTAGYGTGSVAVPYDLRGAYCAMVAHMLKRRNTSTWGMESQSLEGGGSVAFDPTDIPAIVRKVLEKYRRPPA